MSGTKNRIFASFAVLSHRKLLLFVPDNNHTTQKNTGGVWFFIAATPKHHDRKSIVRNAEPHEKRTEHLVSAIDLAGNSLLQQLLTAPAGLCQNENEKPAGAVRSCCKDRVSFNESLIYLSLDSGHNHPTWRWIRRSGT